MRSPPPRPEPASTPARPAAADPAAVRPAVRSPRSAWATARRAASPALLVLMAASLAEADPPAQSVTSKPLANGKGVVWTILAPNIQSASTSFDSIRFMPGDRVTITGGGCADRGGHGSTTTYRYLHPTGDDTDKLWAGTISIPGVTPAHHTVRLDWFVNDPRTIPDSVGPNGTHLLLGYEDNNYADNDYKIDDGVSGQCAGAERRPAHVEITIEKGLPALPAEHVLPFDLESPQRDDNHFLLNPLWHYQKQRLNRLLNPVRECSDHNQPSELLKRCSTQVSGWQNVSYGAPGASVCGGDGHYHYFPVAITGRINWHDCDSGDGDVCFDLRPTRVRVHPDDPNDKSTVVPGVHGGGDATKIQWHLEMNSAETTDRFQSQWWTHYAQIESHSQQKAGFSPVRGAGGLPVPCGKDGACATGLCDIFSNMCVQKNDAKSLVNNEAIAIGMADMDCQHDCDEELHPLFALAIHTKDDPDEDRWAIMVTNSGHQGSCGHQSLWIDKTDFKIRLPPPTKLRKGFVVKDVQELASTELRGSDSRVKRAKPKLDKQTALLEFTLPLPDPSQPRETMSGFVEGELVLKWTGTATLSTAALAADLEGLIPLSPIAEDITAGPKKFSNDEEDADFRRFLEKAPQAKREKLRAALNGHQATAPRPTVLLSPTELTLTPDTRHGEELRRVLRPASTDEQQRELRALCEAFDGKVPGAPANACNNVK